MLVMPQIRDSMKHRGVHLGVAGKYMVPNMMFLYMQELIVIDDLLSALTGIEGRYISINRVGGSEDSFTFHVAGSMDLALQARIFTYVVFWKYDTL